MGPSPHAMGFFSTEALVFAMAPIETALNAFDAERNETEKLLLLENNPANEEEETTTSNHQNAFAILVDRMWKDEYGPSKRYLRNLVRRYVKRLEKNDVPVEDDLLLELVLQASLSNDSLPDPTESGHACFYVPDHTTTNEQEQHHPQRLIRLLVYPHHNDVALRLWEAGGALVEYLLEHMDLIQHKRVLETGAGAGLAGLVLSGYGVCKWYHMTDYTTASIVNLQYNIQLNHQKQDPLRHDDGNDSNDNNNLSCGFLDWELAASYGNDDDDALHNNNNHTTLFEMADVLLAADVVYDVTAVPLLAQTVHRFLRTGGNDKICIFATTLRNRATFDLFEEQLQRLGVGCDCEEMMESLPRIFPIYHVQPRTDIRICKMTLKEGG